MTCQELAVAMDAFLDDELSVVETLRVQAHLVFCHRCRKIVESEVGLRALMEADAAADTAPAALRDRILQLAPPQPPQASLPAPGRSRPRAAAFAGGVLAGAAGAGVVLAAVMSLWEGGPADVSPLIAEVVAKHRIYSQGGEIRGEGVRDPSELVARLARQVGLPLKLPVLARPGERLVSGQLSSIADAPAAYLLYEREGRRISLFVFRGRPGLAPPERPVTAQGVKVYTASLGGRPVVWWEDGAVYYAATSDAGLGNLIEFSLLCVKGQGAASPPAGRALGAPRERGGSGTLRLGAAAPGKGGGTMRRLAGVGGWMVAAGLILAAGGTLGRPAEAADRVFLVVTGEWSWSAKPGEAPVVDRGRPEIRKIERYVFDPGFLVVDKGDRVTLRVHTLKGDKHMVEVPAFKTGEVQVRRGEEKAITFTADRAGVFEILCRNHVSPEKEGPMVGYLYVVDRK